MKAKLTAKLLTLLGFSAVASSCEETMKCMYGTPSASYVFNTHVKDVETGEAIKGIRVSLLERHTRIDNATQEKTEFVDTLATGKTNSQGQVVLRHGGMPLPYNKAEFAADDIDGSENGEYNPTNVEITINSNEYVDDNDSIWDQGKVTKDITLKLHKK